MKVIDLFSKRQKRACGDLPDVYQYDLIPDPLRVQIVHIINDAFGELSPHYRGAVGSFRWINETLCREYGAFHLVEPRESEYASVITFLLKTRETAKVLDVVELVFKAIDHYVREEPGHFICCALSPDEAIAELNHRFREHGVGYQFESGLIVRVDSQLVHAAVVRPALRVLAGAEYEGANAEFLSAHEHYRARKYKECLNDCLKAFESTLKAVCVQREWNFSANDTAKRLLEIVFDNKLIPGFMQSHFTALRTSLESGVPTVRNRLSGHGQGPELTEIPESIAGYVLHLTAANVLLLTRAHAETAPSGGTP